VSKKSKTRRPAQRPRKVNPLGLGPREVTFYVVRFLVKMPAELREGTTAPEWIKRESPPTLDEDQAREAYQAVLDELMTTNAGVRAPQLVVRTVTETVLRDYDFERGAEMADSMAEHLDAANTEAAAEAGDPVDAAIDALADELAAP
jgi:hypothetical protein